MPKRKGDEMAGSEPANAPRRSTRQRKTLESASESPASEIEAKEEPSKSAGTEPTAPTAGESRMSSGRHLTIVEKTGDLFSAPANTVLFHACNCRGHWGHGIAAVFKKRYPKADKLSNDHCNKINKINKDDLPGTAQLIPPQKGDKDKHFIGCLFTSKSYGKTKDKPPAILRNTGTAITDLMRQVVEWNEGRTEGRIKAIWTCKINSGLFNVPWEETKKVMERAELPKGDFPLEIVCMSREE